ncbi:hypothetical protein ACFZDG_13815 [Kitasatospora xanthocidica]|uniref:hypothetical protein n=1 Tax=Kitasatospora xanthocidica TaxID=83382 RepID=UPI0036DFEE7D
MTEQPTGGQWQWPRDAWQPPPVPTAPLPAAPAPAAPRHRSRRVWAAAAVGTGVVLASVLVMCGPGSGDVLSVTALPEASPSASDPAARLLPVSPPPTTPAPSPLPAPVPGGGATGGTGAATAAEAGTADARQASASPRPKPGHGSKAPTPARGASGAPAPAAPGAGASAPGGGPGTICDQAERVGRWPAGSEQARLCRSVYG